jgi:small-conductance mechanosensitive channel
MNVNKIFGNWELFLKNTVIIVSALLVALLLYIIIRIVVRVAIKKRTRRLYDSLHSHLRGPVKTVMPVVMFIIALPLTDLAAEVKAVITHALSIITIVVFSWLLIRISRVFEDTILHKFDMESKDNLRARKIYTQIQFFKRIFAVLVIVLAVALVLISFEKVRQVGTTILASAGIMGIVIGFASQKTLSTIFTGFQIAITQPIRIDDVVIVEGEWGRIEEITLTYVVVRIWDLRRLVLPITYFNEQPFQNWTRVSAELLGTVYLYTDYTMPVDKIREALHSMLEESLYWDKKVWGLQVTDSTDKSLELRALMSAEDASQLWNLRCEIREKLVAFVQEKYPQHLVRSRAELDLNGRCDRD